MGNTLISFLFFISTCLWAYNVQSQNTQTHSVQALAIEDDIDAFDVHAEMETILANQNNSKTNQREPYGASKIMKAIFSPDNTGVEMLIKDTDLGTITKRSFQNYLKITASNDPIAMGELQTCASSPAPSLKEATIKNRCGSLLGLFYIRKYDFSASLEYVIKATKAITPYTDEVTDPYVLALTYDLLFSSYIYNLNQDKAEETAILAINHSNKYHLPYDIDVFIINFMHLYTEVGLPETSTQLFSLYLKYTDNPSGEVFAHLNLLAGKAALKTGDSEDAVRRFKEAIKHSDNPQLYLQAMYSRVTAFSRLGYIHQAKGELDKIDAELVQYPELEELFLSKKQYALSQLAYAQGDLKNAQDLKAQWDKTKIINKQHDAQHKETLERMSQAETILTGHLEASALYARLAQEKIKNQKLLLFISCLLMLILALLCGYIYRRLQKTLTNNKKLRVASENFSTTLQNNNQTLENKQKYIEFIHDRVLHLTGDISHTHNMNNLKTLIMLADKDPNMDMKINDLSHLCHEAKDGLQTHIDKKNLSVCIINNAPEQKFMMSSAYHIKAIITNLLDNAVTASHSQGVVEIKLSKSPYYYGIRVEVIDNGVGFNVGNVPSVHELDKNTGMGLVVVKSCVEMFQGKLDIKSDANKGTTITIDLPDLANHFSKTGTV